MYCALRIFFLFDDVSATGSAGSPYSSFRLMQEIMCVIIWSKNRVLTRLPVRGCKISLARCGGVTHWAVTPDDDGSPMTVCWGQNASNGVCFPARAYLSFWRDDDDQVNLD